MTAENAVVAREAAIAEAQALAWREMLRNVTLPEDHSRLPPYDASRVGDLVLGFEVQEEKSSGVRYIGTLAFRFDAAGVQQVLESYAIPYAASPTPPLVVVPVLDSGGGTVLWEEPNPWREAWVEAARGGGLLDLVVPIGDLVDIGHVRAAQAVAGDRAALGDLAARYQARDTLVVVARDGGGGIAASATHYGNVAQIGPARTDGGSAAGYLAAAKALVDQLENDWKRQNLIRADQQGTIEVNARVGTLSDWALMHQRLEATGAVRRTTVLQLRRGAAAIRLDHYGSADELVSTLGRNGLILARGVDGWTLDVRGGGAMPGAVIPDQTPATAPTGNIGGSGSTTLPGASPGASQ